MRENTADRLGAFSDAVIHPSSPRWTFGQFAAP